MTDYNAMLIDLLNEKIQRLEHQKDEYRKEVNRLKKQIKKMQKSESEGE
ncbi:MAG: hypothetical protein IJW40_03180 [Clostridia bacterium]|nr:hypothetical protein [Clostridia bacterium]